MMDKNKELDKFASKFLKLTFETIES